ncbi:MAG TPA: hypothetical protein VD997_13285 [Phycisphaerales bacterium]|nr:hypothetical protein [Phycisphaerales bacterium]
MRPSSDLVVRLTPALLITLTAASAQAQCSPGWVPGVSAPFSTTVRTTGVLPNGDVLAGGSSGTIGTTPIHRLARYNPSSATWSNVGPTAASNGAVWAAQPLATGDIIAAGTFSQLGGVTVNRVGRYNAAADTWSDLGYGTNGGTVLAILPMPNGDFYIGGNFQRVAGVLRQHVSRWNAANGTWASLNTGMNSSFDEVQALALAPDGTIIVGGAFLTTTGVLGSPRIARYHPTTNSWSGLGSGVDNAVMDIEVLANGDIIAAGYFATAGGMPVNRIARYSPSTNLWSPVGAGVNASASPYIKDLCRLPDGTLAVGGNFTLAGGQAAAHIARLDPATDTWSNIGTGLASDIEHMAVTASGDLVIVGSFGSRIVQWSFGGAAPTINEPPADLTVCTGSGASFSVTATGASSYQWRFNGSAIDTTLNPSGASATLVIPFAAPEHQGQYDCVITGACGSATSSAATLSVHSADFNNDGDIGTDADIEAFFACLGGACCPTCGTSDFNADGDIGTDGDIESFFRVLGGGPC